MSSVFKLLVLSYFATSSVYKNKGISFHLRANCVNIKGTTWENVEFECHGGQQQ